jgi:hypothetical protein
METKLEMAERHVAQGRKAIAKQEALIERVLAAGRDAAFERDLLATFRHTQLVFEDDVAELIAKGD